ncbi:MAG TPA: GxxExxY protein [Planctomycetaceae bacterium]|nr:GxxExxY protein [Planctomycetaceae bacterium]
MPITCPINIPRITDDDMRSIDYAVMAKVFATHNELGRLADEAVYHQKRLQLLRAAGLAATIEPPIELSFRDFSISLAVDLVVEQKMT